MIQTLLNFVQPLAVIVFLVAGFMCLYIKDWHMTLVNLSIANANFWIIYGTRFFK